LFSESIDLIPGQLSVKEFTPEKTGKFRFSCQMGMISGIIEVVNADTTVGSNNSGAQVVNAATQTGDDVVPSGSTGCGCGGGGGSTCGGK